MIIDELLLLLRTGHHSLVVANGSDVHAFNGRGVTDLHRLLTTQPEVLQGAIVADKVVGKGTAALMVLGGVSELHATLISTPSLDMLRTYGVKVHYTMEVEHILNRQGNGLCPVESICLKCETPAECLPLITYFLENLTE